MSYKSEITRRALGTIGSFISRRAGEAGLVGVALGKGRDYWEKLGDGLYAVPNFIKNYTNIYQNLDRLRRIDAGIGNISTGSNNVLDNLRTSLENLRNLQFSRAYESVSRAYESAARPAEGASQIYGVLREIDYNSIWNAGVNLANNIHDKPVDTALAAASVYALGWGASKGIRFLATRGQGSFLDKTERRFGRRIFRRYFRGHPEDLI